MPNVHPVYVFPARNGRTEGQIDLSKWTAKSPLAGYRSHDLRAAFATHVQEALGVSPSVIAATLDHSPASMLGMNSRYLKPGPRPLWAERRAALQAWAAPVTAQTADHAVDYVEPLAVAVE